MALSQTYTQSPVQERLERAKQMAQANSGTTNPEAVKQALAQETFANDQPLNEAVQGQQDSVNALQQLASYDQEVSQKYTQANQAQLAADNQRRAQTTAMGAVDGSNAQATIAQGPASFDINTFAKPVVQDGGFLSPFVASGLTQGQAQATMDTYSLADTTRGARERYLGNEISQLAGAYQAELEAEQEKSRMEEEDRQREETQNMQNFQLELELAEKLGGSVVNPKTGKVYQFAKPAPSAQSKKGTFDIATALQAMRGGSQTQSTPQSPLSGLFSKASSFLQSSEPKVYTVRQKSTGMMGTVPSNEYDPNQYEFIK